LVFKTAALEKSRAVFFSAFGSAGTAASMVEFVFRNFPAQGIAVNAQHFRRAGLIPVGALQNAFDKTLFKLADSLIEEDAALDHQGYQAF
jgi:hypothetical protein